MDPRVFQYIQLALPLIPGLVDEVIGVMERWSEKPETDEAAKAVLHQLVADIKAENERLQSNPQIGDEPPTA